MSFQSITVPREDWYWPKAGTDDEEDDVLEEEREELEETVELTVSIQSFLATIMYKHNQNKLCCQINLL